MRRRYLFENEELKNTKILFIYAGGFQPFGFHHKQVYNQLLHYPIDSEVIITTAGATAGDPQEPLKKSKSAKRDYFNFTEKQKIIHDLFHIDKKLVVNIKNNYQMQPSIENYLLNSKILDNNDIILVWIVGQKDSAREMKHLPLITLSELQANKNNLQNRISLENNQLKFDIHNLGYMLIIPNIIGSGDQILSASTFRNIIQDPAAQLELKLQAFNNYFDQPFNQKNLNHMMIFEKLLESDQFLDFINNLKNLNENKKYLKNLVKNKLLNEIRKWY